MKYFKKIQTGINVEPILNEINHQTDPWGLHNGRQEKIAVQREARSISLRGLRKSKIQDRKRYDVHESRFTTVACHFPQTIAFIEAFAASQNAQLGRAKLVNLPPGNRVYPHVDRGEYYKIRDRYHLILQSGDAGSLLESGGELARMHTGELWWFDNKQIHQSFNDSQIERLHLIFDVLPVSRLHLLAGDPLCLVKPLTISVREYS
jgi:aspartyl/asparaginyl beta-hydroxylase (cupin superfamily)